MIIEELIEPAPADVERLAAQQRREREVRNAENLRAYDKAAGLFPAQPWPVPLTPAEIAQVNGYNVELSVAMIGIHRSGT